MQVFKALNLVHCGIGASIVNEYNGERIATQIGKSLRNPIIKQRDTLLLIKAGRNNTNVF
jgi:hypothetical protein